MDLFPISVSVCLSQKIKKTGDQEWAGFCYILTTIIVPSHIKFSKFDRIFNLNQIKIFMPNDTVFLKFLNINYTVPGPRRPGSSQVLPLISQLLLGKGLISLSLFFFCKY